jgi:hypothetical protein
VGFLRLGTSGTRIALCPTDANDGANNTTEITMHITTVHLLMAAYHTCAAYPYHRSKLESEFARAIDTANRGRQLIHAASLATELVTMIDKGQIESFGNELQSLASEGYMIVGDEWICDALNAAWRL